MLDRPTESGQHITILLCINIGICIFILVGVLISIKDYIKKVGSKIKKKKNVSTIRKKIFKRKKINRHKPKKLPSTSELELNRIQSLLSYESDNDYDFIFDASEF